MNKLRKKVEDEVTERIIFPCPQSLVDRIDVEWHRRRLGSRSETIRTMLNDYFVMKKAPQAQ